MKGLLLIYLGFLFLIPAAAAEDVETEYLRLQEGYSQRIQEIQQRYRTRKRELLNRFILSLVRTEQSARDDGDLEGLIYARDLKEALLEDPQFPELDSDAPPRISAMLEALHRRRAEILEEMQPELVRLNRILHSRLEPVQRQFTREGMLEMALEVRELREVLLGSIGTERER